MSARPKRDEEKPARWRLVAPALPPRLALGRFPTRLHRLERLGARVGLDLWCKRDDESHELYGGNKLRKLEVLLARARQLGRSQLLTCGGSGSNHVVATAVHGAGLNMRTRAVVFEQPPSARVLRNLAACRDYGVQLVRCSTMAHLAARLARELAAGDPDAYFIPAGGSSPLGCTGYVRAARELSVQIAAETVEPPRGIWLPLGSGGTLVGLLVGLALFGVSCHVYAVRTVSPVLCNRPTIDVLRRRVERLLGDLGTRVDRRIPYTIIGDQLGPGYGHATPAALEACRLAGELEGVRCETTYSGKALAALLERSPALRSPQLFWATYSARDPP